MGERRTTRIIRPVDGVWARLPAPADPTTHGFPSGRCLLASLEPTFNVLRRSTAFYGVEKWAKRGPRIETTSLPSISWMPVMVGP